MAEVRKLKCEMDTLVDFAPSEMYLVVLTQDDNETLCKYAVRFDHDKQPALKSIIDGSLNLLHELLV